MASSATLCFSIPLIKPPPPRTHSFTRTPKPTLLSPPILSRQPFNFSALSFPPKSSRRRLIFTPSAYAAAPASDPNVNENQPHLDDSSSTEGTVLPPPPTISWGLVSTLLLRHKLRLAVSVLTLIGCTTCTLSMPILSGQFFEVIIGARPDPLWKLLSFVAVFYTLEPIFTTVFITTLNNLWEKVMTKLRAIMSRKILSK